MMKNILSAIAVLSLFGASAVGAFFLSQRAFNEKPVARELNPEEAAIEISQRLGEPFVKAWAARDVQGIKSLARGEFGGGTATSIEWSIESNPPFETKQRSCTEEEQESTNEFDEFFGCLLDPIAGLENVQTEFSVLNAIYYSRKNGDMYHCRLLLRMTGINKENAVKTYESEQDVIVTLPVEDAIVPPSFRTWQIREELVRESTGPVADQIFDLLSKQGIEISRQSNASMDVADLEGDNDMDIAMTLAGGQRFVFAFNDGKYSNVTQALGITSDEAQPSGQESTRTVWFDFNDDGFPDLISGDRMFENKNGKEFVDVTEQVGLKKLMGPSEINSMGLVRQHFLSK
jgi:hypothetical protein